MSAGPRVALVTGAGSGIGAACAKRLASDGYVVAVACHAGREGAERVASAIIGAGGRAATYSADLSDQGAAADLVDRVTHELGGLNVLINNAAVGGMTPLATLTAAEFDLRMAVNVRAPLLLIQAARTPLGLVSGAVVNVSSVNGRAPVAGASIYSASKAALDALTKALAVELGPEGIRVNAVAPGLTDSERRMRTHTEEAALFAGSKTPLGRLGRCEEVAEAVSFLCSPASSWITGEVLGVTGGYGLA